MRTIRLAATQMACSWDIEGNLDRAERLVREAAGQGAQVVLLQELFATPYFCIDTCEKSHFEYAVSYPDASLIQRFAKLAKELSVVLPLSYFERGGDSFYNSLCMIDADGSILPNYRKSHIPEGPGYEEKNYFSPGQTGFMVWDTRYGRLGAAICWDQWFPETARCLALEGAEVIFYPTAIGSEPEEPNMDSRDHWQRVMQGHSGANLVPVVASNRIGTEQGEQYEITFYGSSFITDQTGAKVQEASRDTEEVLVHQFNLDEIAEARRSWGVFRDRRPDLYRRICN